MGKCAEFSSARKDVWKAEKAGEGLLLPLVAASMLELLLLLSVFDDRCCCCCCCCCCFLDNEIISRVSCKSLALLMGVVSSFSPQQTSTKFTSKDASHSSTSDASSPKPPPPFIEARNCCSKALSQFSAANGRVYASLAWVDNAA